MPAGPSDDKRKIRPDTFRGHPACLYHTFLFTGLRHGFIAMAAIFKSGSAHNIR